MFDQPGPAIPGTPPPANPGIGGARQALPPEIARHIDPNNQMQTTLLKRIMALTPEEGEAFLDVLTPQAAQTLKKIIPEVGFLLDMIGDDPAVIQRPASALGSL